MNFGVALTFDPQTETAIRGLWQSIAAAGLPSFMSGVDYPPHMTLFMAEEVDLPAYQQQLSILAYLQPLVPIP